ncbi:MAG: MFS transporter [Planctomycetota bacterium]|nr:MFS transporter [Planctomycetota bacterium]
MPKPLPNFRSHLTLALCTILHGFTHAYGTMLVPLYFRMSDDLKLPGVRKASLVVTVYGAVYFLGSYIAGIVADRFDRKLLLSIGLLGNAAAILGIGLSRDYQTILLLAVAAGLFGTLFHPAANALAPSHYPKAPGMAIGLLGIGSGLGFFFGPQYAGWRATTASWQWGNVAQWQKPCVELGIMGLIVGVIFLFAGADPEISQPNRVVRAMDSALKRRVLAVAGVLMFRDFAGFATISLASIYVTRCFGMSVQQAGLFVGLMMLPSVLINPLSVYFTPRQRRLPGLSLVLASSALVVITTPFWPARFALIILCIFQTMQMASYAISDASILERVSPEFRGRVAGLFLLVAGTFSALGPWVMASWTDYLGPRAANQIAYAGPFGLVAVFMLIAAAVPPLIQRLGPASGMTPISPAEEISPATMGSVV